MKILVVYTGGTIGMLPSEHGYVPVAGFAERLQAQLGESAGQLPQFDLVELERLIDSSNVLPEDWRQIALLLERQWSKYDGFVVLHGTDTMAYTASALSFMLQGCDKPVILTGSQIPLAELRNDALDNLITSLLLAASGEVHEVCVYFNGRLLRGNRTRKVRSTGFDAFDSPNCPWLGQVGIDIDLRRDLLLAAGTPCFQIPQFDPAAVVSLFVYPGMPARLIEAALDDPRVRGLVLHTYGVGNPPDADTALIDALERACARGVTVLNITQCHQGAVSQGAYATGATLNRIGVIPGSDLTPEAAFTKLHLLLALDLRGDRLQKALIEPICGECTA
ncbi:type I asparaginase [Marinobacterium sp. D7]|uniref:type I asparaginase n=1 Tax=Marinobacterium ramblicola TaxID=2849041 RepID=UPI001C2D3917|nr:type I asparaginase [Marinobacterium ramblicola]MBV1787598.1 type I asparaginase [Marinobacterium ramblicola]